MGGSERVGSRSTLEDSRELTNEWMLAGDDKVGGVKDDSQVSHNKSLSLQRKLIKEAKCNPGLYQSSLRIKSYVLFTTMALAL